jgi:hypothetical protein
MASSTCTAAVNSQFVFLGSIVVNQKSKATSSGPPHWETGEALSFAWWDFATKEARREYQTCQIDSRRISHRLDMKFDVLEDLVAGKLIAFGFRDGVVFDEGPVLIPAHLFPRGGEDTAVVDWDNSVLRSSGFSFLRIRVARPEVTDLGKTRVEGAESERTDLRTTRPVTPRPTSTPVPTTPRKKMGRPPVGEQLRVVIRTLVVSGELENKSRKAQIERIRAAARTAYPKLFLTETQPSRDKILWALSAEGLTGAKEQSS